MVVRLVAMLLSMVWAALAVVLLQTPPSLAVLLVVLSYTLVGGGIPTAAALTTWIRSEETGAPPLAVLGLVTLTSSFAASALGGQPLIWTGHWTATRQVVATMATGLMIALVAALVDSGEGVR